jgi:branched-chain amino acid transport system substrate-binding protein
VSGGAPRGSRVKQARPALALLLLACVTSLAGCGIGAASSATPALAGNRIAGRTLTIYSSVPLHGASGVGGRAVVDGELMALERIGERIGHYRIALRTLDDSTARSGRWDPGQTTINSRLARTDPTTIGYLGEFNSGASAVSIPVLNRGGIPQITATNTAVGLTSASAAASPGEPEKYYPAGIRTFVRVVPGDSVQAAVQVRLQKAQGCTRSFVLDDGDVDGADTATSFQLAAQAAGLRVVGVQGYDPLAAGYLALARAVAQTGADCVLISADTENHAALLTEQVAAALPHASLFGTSGLAESTYTDPQEGGLSTSLDSRLLITSPTLAARLYPPSGRAFLAAYAQRYGEPQPYAIFGYEAMSLMLRAISRATRDGRSAAERSKVRDAIFSTSDRRSVLGTYSIDSNGDTSLRRYGVYRVVNGQLRFWKAMTG